MSKISWCEICGDETDGSRLCKKCKITQEDAAIDAKLRQKDNESRKCTGGKINKQWFEGLKIESGALSKYGYKIATGSLKRQKALLKAVKSEGYATIIRRLNLLAVWNKNKNPSVTRTIRTDMNWMRKSRKIAKMRE